MKGIRKQLVMNNPKMRALMVSVDGTAGTPAASGFDASQILSVVDNGAGDYTINLKYPFNPNSSIQAIPSSQTPGVQAVISAVAYNVVTVQCFDAATGATPTDCDFDLLILGNDGRLTY